MWRVSNETRDLNNGIEAVRNYLVAETYDKAVTVAEGCLAAMTRFQQTLFVAVLASEVVAYLPEDHEGFANIADQEARAFPALGHTESTFDRYSQLLARQETLCREDPDNLSHLRNLSVSYNKMGDLYTALGDGEKAREAYAQSLAIREPDRADSRRDLAVSYVKLGFLQLPDSPELLEHAHGILSALKEAGKLNPVDEPFLLEIQNVIHLSKNTDQQKPEEESNE